MMKRRSGRKPVREVKQNVYGNLTELLDKEASAMIYNEGKELGGIVSIAFSPTEERYTEAEKELVLLLKCY